MKCPRCQTPNAGKSIECRSCGWLLNERRDTRPDLSTKHQHKKPGYFSVLPIILLLVGIGGVGAWTYSRQQNKKLPTLLGLPASTSLLSPTTGEAAPTLPAENKRLEHQLLYTESVTDDIKQEILPYYSRWKQAHNQTLTTIETLSAFYSANARIEFAAGNAGDMERYSNFVLACRDTGVFTKIVEVRAPLWAVDNSTGRIEMLAFHRYDDKDGKLGPKGKRRLIWEKRGGQWVIAQDQLPFILHRQ